MKIKQPFLLTAFLLATGFASLGCGNDDCEYIVDRQVDCDTTGFLRGFRGAALSACRESDADLTACRACLEDNPGCELSACDEVCNQDD
ncbi:MAG: hypothetical protein KF901_19990 [Myxococcales bacterium]|nr:hypothetical protein [Myxococcales bacterium]